MLLAMVTTMLLGDVHNNYSQTIKSRLNIENLFVAAKNINGCYVNFLFAMVTKMLLVGCYYTSLPSKWP